MLTHDTIGTNEAIVEKTRLQRIPELPSDLTNASVIITDQEVEKNNHYRNETSAHTDLN